MMGSKSPLLFTLPALVGLNCSTNALNSWLMSIHHMIFVMVRVPCLSKSEVLNALVAALTSSLSVLIAIPINGVNPLTVLMKMNWKASGFSYELGLDSSFSDVPTR